MPIRTVASAIVASLILTSIPFVSVSRAYAQQTSVTVPTGTVIPLTLVNPIKSKSTHPGDTIRASVAFPVTVGDQVAIPAGAYVEGVLGQPLPKVKHQPDPGVQIHFTRLVFANGSSAPIDAVRLASLDGSVPPLPPDSPAQPPSYRGSTSFGTLANSFAPGNRFASIGFFRLPAFGTGWSSLFVSLQAFPPITPTTPTLPKNNPPVALLFGITFGVAAAFIAIGILLHHKAGGADFIVHDAGWQFQMKLESPLTLNPAVIQSQNPAK